jgi:hypothetical protein
MPPERWFCVALVGVARLPSSGIWPVMRCCGQPWVMTASVLLPLPGPISWMPDWLDAVRASEGYGRWGLSAGLFPWRGKSALIGEGDCLGSVACVNLGEQVVDVALDGAFADDEVLGDLAV